MDVKEFIKMFENEVEDLYKSEIIDKSELTNHAHTLLINVAIWNTIKSYNEKSSSKFKIIPEKGGRLPSDFLIKNEKVELAIEHEHDRRDKNHKKGIEGNYNKLQAITDAKKLLICYLNSEDYDKDFKKYINPIFKKEDKIYILIGTKKNGNDFTDSMEYKELICPNGDDCNASED